MNKRIALFDGYLTNNNIIFSNNFYSGLFKVDVTNGQVDLIRFFENDINDVGIGLFHKKVIGIKDKLLLLPGNSENIFEYNINTNEWDFFPCCIGEVDLRFSAGAHLKDDTLIIVPGRYGIPIVALDVNSKKISVLNEFSSIGEQAKQTEHCFMTDNYCRVNGSIWFVLYGTNTLCKYDEEKNTVEKKDLFINSLVSVDVVDENTIALTAEHDSNIYLYSIDSGNVETIEIKGTKSDVEGRFYSKIVKYKDTIVCLPGFQNKIYIINLADKSIEREYTYKQENIYMNNDKLIGPLTNGCIDDDSLWILPFNSNMLLRIDEDKIKEISLAYSSKELAESLAELRLENAIARQELLRDEQEADLEDFIRVLCK